MKFDICVTKLKMLLYIVWTWTYITRKTRLLEIDIQEMLMDANGIYSRAQPMAGHLRKHLLQDNTAIEVWSKFASNHKIEKLSVQQMVPDNYCIRMTFIDWCEV